MAQYVIFSARYAPLVGGVETYTANLSNELVAQGHKVKIVTCKITESPDYEKLDNGVEVYRVPASNPLGPRLPLAHKNKQAHDTYELIASQGVDRVVVNTRFYRLSRHGVQFAKKYNAPALVIDHGSAYLTMGNKFLDIFIRAYEHIATRWIKKYNPMFAGVSQASVKWLKTFGISTDKVVPNAIDANGFRRLASERNFKNELGIDKDTPIYVAVGRLTSEKGAQYLPEIAKYLKEGHIIWAGEGPLRREIEETHCENIHLIGNTKRDDLSSLLQQADVFFLPTRSEGFCTSLLEASACGVPSVMPHVGGTDEVMGDPPRFGRIISIDNLYAFAGAIEDVAEDSHENQELHERIKDYTQTHCSWNHTLHCLDKAFEAND